MLRFLKKNNNKKQQSINMKIKTYKQKKSSRKKKII